MKKEEEKEEKEKEEKRRVKMRRSPSHYHACSGGHDVYGSEVDLQP